MEPSQDPIDVAYDEGRAETLFRVREAINKGMDARAYIEERLEKIRSTGHMPPSFDRDNRRTRDGGR